MMITNANRRILKFFASADQQMPASGTPLVLSENSRDVGPGANFSIGDLREISGLIRSQRAGSLLLEQGVYRPDGTIAWIWSDTVTITASTVTTGAFTGAGFRVADSNGLPWKVFGEVLRVTWTASSGGASSLFELFLKGN